MGYNVPNWGTVAKGATIPVSYWINNGEDFGAQFAEGKPQGGGSLTSFDHNIFSNGRQVVYTFFLRNDGNEPAVTFMLCGGGLT